jgi:CheY-like chemotaxis protein
MIVENNASFHHLYQTMLKGPEYKYIHAYDGYEAMEKIGETIPDLIILDMLMDMVTGDTFFMYLKNVPEYANIPVIIISSSIERPYSHLRENDPSLVFIEKRHLSRERLIDEVNKKTSVIKKTNRVTFRLPEIAAPDAKRVCIVGDFNKWNTNANPMRKLKNGDYTTVFNLEPGREYQFRYLIDESKWINDSDADKYVKSPYENIYNSVVITRN